MVALRDMRASDRALCICYVVFTVVDFVIMSWLTVSYALTHGEHGVLAVPARFVRDALADPAGVFIYVDLTLVWFVLSVFMVVEARRLGIRYVWAYIVGAPLLALNVSFPLFMLVRQVKLARTSGGTQ